MVDLDKLTVEIPSTCPKMDQTRKLAVVIGIHTSNQFVQ